MAAKEPIERKRMQRLGEVCFFTTKDTKSTKGMRKNSGAVFFRRSVCRVIDPRERNNRHRAHKDHKEGKRYPYLGKGPWRPVSFLCTTIRHYLVSSRRFLETGYRIRLPDSALRRHPRENGDPEGGGHTRWTALDSRFRGNDDLSQLGLRPANSLAPFVSIRVHSCVEDPPEVDSTLLGCGQRLLCALCALLWPIFFVGQGKPRPVSGGANLG